MKPDRLNELISLTEAAREVDMSADFFRRLCEDGRMKGRKIGRNWVTTHAWVKQYLASRTVKYIPKRYRKKR